MDTEITELLQKIKDAKRTPFWQSTPEQARSGPMLMDLLFGPAPDVARVEDFSIASSNGHALPVRLYVPREQPRGLIVYFHGGGWVVGSVASYHPLTATLAARTGCAVLSVDYRLAPEHPFPLPLDDAIAALRWSAEEAETRLGGPVARLIAMGDSAGGNLATVAARLHNRTDTARPVDLQILAYPVTGHDFDTGSYQAFAEGHLLTRRDMMWFWDQYLPDPAQRDNPLASPLHAPDLSHSPPALILSAGCDPLRDEGEAYGQRLLASGVDAQVLRCDGLVHGFLAMIHYAPSASRAFDRILAAVDLATA
ncbi:alpha/beta hydrolase [Hydrogenophaga sp.]|uniref:alpha/beta hydrolase n=1 Tax=Hydrogenophaga sp. TaxID=1904254 RepID=UPI003563860D